MLFIITCNNQGEQMSDTNKLPDFDTLWNYSNPTETRAAFEKLLPQAKESGDSSYHLQLLTQIARTYGLEGNFDEAHKTLDNVENLMTDNLKLVKVRYLLERGRAFRSSKQVDKSVPLFEESYKLASEIGEDNFTIDAAHMMALVVDQFDIRMKWSLKALQQAEKTSDTRAKKWKGSLLNNMGWDYHDNGQYYQALGMFQRALVYRESQNSQPQINIAKWSVARCYRSLEQYDKALEMQLALYADFEKTGETDGYVFEELGELYLLKDDIAQSEKFFALAYQFLSKDKWMMENESARIERIKKLGKVH